SSATLGAPGVPRSPAPNSGTCAAHARPSASGRNGASGSLPIATPRRGRCQATESTLLPSGAAITSQSEPFASATSEPQAYDTGAPPFSDLSALLPSTT